MAKLTKEQARYALIELRNATSFREKQNTRMLTTFTDGRYPVSIRVEMDKRNRELELLYPVVEFLAGIAGE